MRRLSMACDVCMLYMIRPTTLPEAATQPLQGPVSSARPYVSPSFACDPSEKPAPQPVLRRGTMRI